MSSDLPTVLALRMSEEPQLPEGTTQPLVISCAPINDWGKMRDYAVKFNTKLNLRRNSLAFGIVAEIISGYLAQHFKIEIPEFCLVEISNSFKDAVASNTHIPANILQVVNQNVHNYNFGSRIVELETASPLPLQVYSPEQLEAAAQIFAFDALIYNADRTEETPNLWSVDEHFVIYDHEKAFNFVADSGNGLEKNWVFRTPDGASFVHQHIFHPILRKRGIDFEEFVERLNGLDDSLIEQVLENIPYPLKKEFDTEINRIVSYLESTRDNPEKFRLNLTGVLL